MCISWEFMEINGFLWEFKKNFFILSLIATSSLHIFFYTRFSNKYVIKF